jgi:hypothetical protein
MTTWTSTPARRLYSAVAAAISLSTAATAAAPTAGAEETCSYELSPPHLATLAGGVVQVTATLTPVACTGSAHPNTNSVCVSASDSSSKCATINGWNTAQVFIDPIGSGHYVSTGNGCVDRSSSLKLTCTPYGPLNGGA